MRIAIYSRVSTGHQVEHQTIEQQIERLTAHVGTHATKGWTLDPAQVFRDDGYSGAALARPGLDRLRDAIKGQCCSLKAVKPLSELSKKPNFQCVGASREA